MFSKSFKQSKCTIRMIKIFMRIIFSNPEIKLIIQNKYDKSILIKEKLISVKNIFF